MNMDRLTAQLKSDEGYRLKVYKDTRGLPTVGIGHLVTPTDMLNLGDTITEARCDELFQHDIARTIAGCEREISGWAGFPEEVQEILVNMAFQLGITGLLGFKVTLGLIRSQKYAEASRQMLKSLWATQTPNRANRLARRLELVPSEPAVCPACHRPL